MSLSYTTSLDLTSDFYFIFGNWFNFFNVPKMTTVNDSTIFFSKNFYDSLLNCLCYTNVRTMHQISDIELNIMYMVMESDYLIFKEWSPYEMNWFTSVLWCGLPIVWNLSICIYFFYFYFMYLFMKMFMDIGSYRLKNLPAFSFFIELYLLLWIIGGEDKVETSEEMMVLMVLWPWCVFLIFSHIFSFSENTIIFGFAEWGLPVLYGYILLIEHTWVFGVYIIVYLMGISTRKSILVNMIEDLVAMIIMVARVSLQMVRGIMVGMFHLMCSEALLNMNSWWSSDVWMTNGTYSRGNSTSWIFDFFILWVDLWVAAGSLIIVTAIMFLQLIFLIVSVWLFCKCWYISWMPIFYKNFSLDLEIKNNYFLNLDDASPT